MDTTAVRMVMCVLCAVLVLGLGAHAWRTEYTVTGQEEGEECHRHEGAVWTCKRETECEGLQDILSVNGKLRTCSWKGRSPILCCPPKQESERIQNSKSEKKCADYGKLLCSDEFVLASQAQPLGSLERKKRQDSINPDLETTTFEPIVSNVVGGRLTLPKEFPSMNMKFFKRKKRQDFNQTNVETTTERENFAAFVAGGRLTQSAEFPSMALIGYGDPGAISWQCGGSLISENFVLSAAHCVNTPYGLARWVRLGDLDLKSDREEARPQQLEIVERVVHPGYRSPAFYNDLALFRLDRAVVYDRFVRPACLHTDTRDPAGVGTAAGWGKNETHGPRSSALMQVDISFVPAEECKTAVGVVKKYLPNGVDSDTMVCAGELGKDTCQGDSGGPLILPSTPWSTRDCLAKLVGVTSFGPRNCGMTSVPGAYVRVAHFLPWIESIVWKE